MITTGIRFALCKFCCVRIYECARALCPLVSIVSWLRTNTLFLLNPVLFMEWFWEMLLSDCAVRLFANPLPSFCCSLFSFCNVTCQPSSICVTVSTLYKKASQTNFSTLKNNNTPVTRSKLLLWRKADVMLMPFKRTVKSEETVGNFLTVLKVILGHKYYHNH